MVYLSVSVVDDDFSRTLLEDNPGNGGFPAAGAEDCLRSEASRQSGFHVLLNVGGLQLHRQRDGRHSCNDGHWGSRGEREGF